MLELSYFALYTVVLSFPNGTSKVPPFIVASLTLNTATWIWFLKIPLLITNIPPSSFLIVFKPPSNVPPLIVSLGFAWLIAGSYWL